MRGKLKRREIKGDKKYDRDESKAKKGIEREGEMGKEEEK
jgi:hypothetical protein